MSDMAAPDDDELDALISSAVDDFSTVHSVGLPDDGGAGASPAMTLFFSLRFGRAHGVEPMAQELRRVPVWMPASSTCRRKATSRRRSSGGSSTRTRS